MTESENNAAKSQNLTPSNSPLFQGGEYNNPSQPPVVPRRGMSKSKIFLVFCLAFVLGVWVGKYANLETMVVLAMFFIILGTLFWNNKYLRVAGFAIIFLALGFARFSVSIDNNPFKSFYDKKISIVGVVSEEPDVLSDKTYLTFSRLKYNHVPIDGKILASVQRYPEYTYGDELEIFGTIKEPKEAEAKGEFSYKDYLSRFGISAVIYYPEIELISTGNGNVIKGSLLTFKKLIVGNLSQTLPEPHNSFLSALLVGLRRGLPDDLLEKF